MIEDKAGNLWLATAGMGLLKLDRQQQRFLRYQYSPSDPESLSENHLTTLFQDSRGNIWIGLDAQPPAIFVPRAPLFFQLWPSRMEPASKAESLVSALFEDRDGRDWIGWFGGLTRVDRRTGESRFYSTSGSGIGASAISIIQERSGSLWIGTHGQGLKHFDPRLETFTTYHHDATNPHSLSNDVVSRLLIDHTDKLWAATWDGLNRFNPATGRFDVFRPEPEGTIQQFGWIVEDPHGMIWLGGNSGLTRFDTGTGRFQVYKHDPDDPHSISSNRVIYVYFDRSGVMWIGTQNGLGRRDPTTGAFATYTNRNGLAGNVVACVQEDDSGALWMSTNRGISRFDPQRGTFRNYSAADGLPGDDLTGWSACYKNTVGEILFGGFSGAVVFDPKRFAEDDEPPQVVLTDLMISGKSVEVGEDSPLKQPVTYVHTLSLSHLQRNFSLEFAALTYLNLARNRYRYKLEGFDQEWNGVGSNQRAVNYTALPSGSYTFHVQAAGLRGEWSAPGAVLNIRILPPWWSTWWFRTLYSALILLLIWSIYRYRLGQMARQYQLQLEARVSERTRIARELHDTLLQGFHGLLLRFQTVSNLLPDRPAEAKQRLESAIDHAAQAITESRDAVQQLRSSTVVTNDLPLALSALGKELAADEINQNSAVFRVEVEGTPRNLHPILRDEVYRIAAEGMRNAFRHAQARQIEVEIRYDERQLRVRVRDDGKGVNAKLLNEEGRTGHWGLNGMYERAKLVGANLDVWSKLDSGTEVELSVPASIAYATSPAPR
jgi:signal transduction histidine kinase/streptogramin lyase